MMQSPSPDTNRYKAFPRSPKSPIVPSQQQLTMRRLARIPETIWEKLLLLGAVLAVSLPFSPLNMPAPYRDSGVFLYTGWRILSGDLPYRDVWDHKPPLIYYINACGLAISQQSRWGVWIMELIALLVAALLGYHLIKRWLGTIPAVLSVVFWLLTLVFVIDGGNLTEEYALPLQFAVLWLVLGIDKPSFSFWRYFLMGLLGAAAFLTKQTTIGLWIALAIYLICIGAARHRAAFASCRISVIALGWLLVCATVAVFFAVQGGLAQFWNQVFYFNLVYASPPLSLAGRFTPAFRGIEPLTSTGFLQVSMFGYVLAGILAVYRQEAFGSWLPLILIGLIDLPIEILLVSVSGRTYRHYYITMLPVLTLFTGVTFWVLLRQLRAWQVPRSGGYLLSVGFAAVLLWSSIGDYVGRVRDYEHVEGPAAIASIRSLATPDESVLIWGGGGGENFLAQRASPSRFVYQDPLYDKRYVDQPMIQGFLADIIANRPKLIVDTNNTVVPFLKFPIHASEIRAMIVDIRSRYREVQYIGDWTIYEDTRAIP